MGYLTQEEHNTRIRRVRKLMEEKTLDIVLVYYDEFNIGNLFHQPASFGAVLQGRLMKIGAHPAFQVDGFAHVNNFALRIFVQVYARFVG